MALIIADSGATKTEWILVENSKIISTSTTIGFNPYYYTTEELTKSINDNVLPQIKSTELEAIYFYGSGISTENKKQVTKSALELSFPKIRIEIEHDLLAAARGMLKDKAGIACILGTGSNSCVYDGKDISHNIPSLGYFFADEGSGTHIGKLFIEDYLRDKLPKEIKDSVETEHNLSIEYILDKIYNQCNPNKFLSSFSYFVSENIDNSHLAELVKKSFRLFFETYIINYPNYEKLPLKFMGSVALIHEILLKEVAYEFKLTISSVIKSPIEGLIEYHSK